MKKFTLPTLLLLLVCTSTQAQTKRIAHRSHSGTNQHFSLSGSDNFGNPPEKYKYVTPVAEDSTKAASEGTKQGGNGKKVKVKKAPARKAKIKNSPR